MLDSLRHLFSFSDTLQVIRTPAEQDKVEALSSGLALFQYALCPYCVRVRRAMRKRGLQLLQLDVIKNEEARTELVLGGGKLQVPCLRIEQDNGDVQWLYESGDIIRFLERRFTLCSDAI